MLHSMTSMETQSMLSLSGYSSLLLVLNLTTVNNTTRHNNHTGNHCRAPLL